MELLVTEGGKRGLKIRDPAVEKVFREEYGSGMRKMLVKSDVER